MSIRESSRKIKAHLHDLPGDLAIVLIIILTATGSFGLGRISAKSGLSEHISVASAAMADTEPMPLGGLLVASSRGSRYHFPWCAGAQQIAAQNKIWFESATDAREAGYTPARNCKGLE